MESVQEVEVLLEEGPIDYWYQHTVPCVLARCLMLAMATRLIYVAPVDTSELGA